MAKASSSLRILVTDAQELAGLGVIRSLGRAGHHVTAAFPAGRHTAAAHSRWCHAYRAYPDPWREQFAFRAWLVETLRNGEYDAVLPVAEAAMFAVAAVQGDLPKDIIPILPNEEHLRLVLSKYHAGRAALSAGLPVPRTVFVNDGSEDGLWDEDLSPLQFPFILKTDNVLTPEGVYRKGRCITVKNPEEAQDVLRECRALHAGIIAQEIVPGFGIGVSVLRWERTARLTFTHHRIHEVPWTGGASSYRESCHDPVLEEQARALLNAIGYQGIAMVEFRHPGGEGAPVFLEMNGRFWGSLALALHAEVDFPAALLDCITRGSPSAERRQADYSDGLRCRSLPQEIKYVTSVFHASAIHGDTPSPSKIYALLELIMLTLHPRIRSDEFWWSDPLPGFVQTLLLLLDLTKGLLHRLRLLRQAGMNRRIIAEAKRMHRERLHRGGQYFPSPPRKILFLCNGNICRSPFAALRWNKEAKEGGRADRASSAGFLRKADRPIPLCAQAMMVPFGVDPSGHSSKQVTSSMIHEADVIFIMDLQNWHALMKIFSSAREKTLFLGLFAGEDSIEIADPCRRCPSKCNPLEARAVFRRIEWALDALQHHCRLS